MTTPDPAPTGPSGTPGLGTGIAARLRPRLALSGRRGAARRIGVVARSSAGFGRTIGRPSSGRQRIERLRDRGTGAIRPPFVRWHDDEPFDDARAGSGRAEAPSSPSRRVERAAPAARPATDIPEFGDRKVDALRRLLTGGSTPAPSSPSASDADRTGDGDGHGGARPGAPAAVVAPSGPVRRARGPVDRSSGRPGDTTAGPATGPGQFARRFARVPVAADDRAGIPTAAAMTPPSPPSSDGTPSAPADSGRRDPTGPARGARERVHRSASDQVSALRRLVEGGGGGQQPGPGSGAGHRAPSSRDDARPTRGSAGERASGSAGDRPVPGRRDDPSAAAATGRPDRAGPRIDRTAVDAVRSSWPTDDPTGDPGADLGRAGTARIGPPAGVPVATARSTPADPDRPATAARRDRPAPTPSAPASSGRTGVAPVAPNPAPAGRSTSGSIRPGGASSVAPRADRPGRHDGPAPDLGAHVPGEAPGRPGALALATEPVATVLRRPADEVRRARMWTHLDGEVNSDRRVDPLGSTHAIEHVDPAGDLAPRPPAAAPITVTDPVPAIDQTAGPRRRDQRAETARRSPMTDLARRVSLPRTDSSLLRPATALTRSIGAGAFAPLAPAPDRPSRGVDNAPPALTRHHPRSPDEPRVPAMPTATGPTPPRPASNAPIPAPSPAGQTPARPTPAGSTPAGGTPARPTASEAFTGPLDDRRDPPAMPVRPGTMFRSERRRAATPAARRSPVSPGPGVLRRALEPSPASRTDTGADDRTDSGAATRVGARPGARGARPASAPDSGETVADRFLGELARGRAAAPVALPAAFTPMAEAIAGRRSVLISTDEASRRALRSVGKVAATTGDVIHLARAPRPDARSAEIMAHELTHVAHPSPAPRFFDDDVRGPEERRAEQIGRIMARAPLAPTAPIAEPAHDRRDRLAPAQASDAATIRRRPATNPPPPTVSSPVSSSGRSVSADALAAQLTGAVAGGGRRVQRRITGSPSGAAPTTNPAASPGDAAPGASGTTSSAEPADEHAGAGAIQAFLRSDDGIEWFREQLRDNVEMVFRAIEDHIVVELERRGGRGWGGL